MKKRKITKEFVEFYADCVRCGKEIRGTTESMVSFNMHVHQQSKECKKA